jgi:hypothetical protein
LKNNHSSLDYANGDAAVAAELSGIPLWIGGYSRISRGRLTPEGFLDCPVLSGITRVLFQPRPWARWRIRRRGVT